MAKQSGLYQAIEKLLDGRDLAAIVTERRRYAYSWRAIARELSDLTGTDVSDEWLRRRFSDGDQSESAA